MKALNEIAIVSNSVNVVSSYDVYIGWGLFLASIVIVLLIQNGSINFPSNFNGGDKCCDAMMKVVSSSKEKSDSISVKSDTIGSDAGSEIPSELSSLPELSSFNSPKYNAIVQSLKENNQIQDSLTNRELILIEPETLTQVNSVISNLELTTGLTHNVIEKLTSIRQTFHWEEMGVEIIEKLNFLCGKSEDSFVALMFLSDRLKTIFACVENTPNTVNFEEVWPEVLSDAIVKHDALINDCSLRVDNPNISSDTLSDFDYLLYMIEKTRELTLEVLKNFIDIPGHDFYRRICDDPEMFGRLCFLNDMAGVSTEDLINIIKYLVEAMKYASG